ncbi:DUF1294 domain-containing protein [Desulfobulbus oligotrophicus]|uniref:DUF1294 domain-containing protein n=1 Tax=Desulfobulbus oligotrophicus TaxID=1909699 RepID=A0A7T6AQP0_9BACT|nr:cold shock and DUF1294 domain-containing protein [Desulfobulbus oligotrophicus]QQG65673.1 DUF1294 domain-containing protein [Desulfobulbus oligotrophicus]
MKYAGKITEWNDDRGFGFIEPKGGGNRVFVHISNVKSRSRRPIIEDPVTYSMVKDSQGRLQATRVSLAAAQRISGSQVFFWLRITLGFFALVLVALASALHKLPLIIAGSYFLCSLISFLAYTGDKRAAKRGAWRTPESTLHLLDFLGGWPGGIIAQQILHHKTVKGSFQFVFWLSVLANIGGVWWLVVSEQAVQPIALLSGWATQLITLVTNWVTRFIALVTG